ncbi:MAG: CAAX geranylgeranyltransferase alpha subunit [Geoglossum umbratile]|nr:MAG: CAAX geranylgeranyltransferase alpha subunit [Geoglossum umbratile]
MDYSTSPLWADIVPIPQNDGPHPLASIAYTSEYSEAMGYLRAMMAAGEHSKRVLSLTMDVIAMNPAHYTVWLYRAKTVFEIGFDLKSEMAFLNHIALLHQKNYQIWHHRQLIMERLGDPTGEDEFIAKMFAQDAKNYHVWSYRQWLVRHFSLFDSPTELSSTSALILSDVRNNSAWNHRFFLVFGRKDGNPAFHPPPEIIEREIDYAKTAVFKAPQNPCPWVYLRGVIRSAGSPLSELLEFAAQFAPLDRPDEVRSSHALDVLADIFAETEGKKEDAVKVMDLLAQKYDPIRANYWRYRRAQLAPATAAATA